MGTVTRPRLLLAAFCLSLCGLGLTAGARLAAQTGTVPSDYAIDDGDPGFTSDGFTLGAYYPGAVKSDVAYAIRTSAATASWEFTNVAPGTYRVVASYGWHPNRTANAAYVVTVNGTSVLQTTVNQSVQPANPQGAELGTVTIASATDVLKVALRAGADSTTIADAIRLWKQGTAGGTAATPSCGDGNVQTGEQCDDWNRNAGDGCSANCAVEQGWTCVTGGSSGGTTGGTGGAGQTVLPSACTRSACGNNRIDSNEGGMEQCDDGNAANGDGCSATCVVEQGWTCPQNAAGVCQRAVPTCGNGVFDAGETCDLGNPRVNLPFSSDNRRGCNTQCQHDYCGDGTTDAYLRERCDDGNKVNGDGCSAICQPEAQYVCGYRPAGGGVQCESMFANACAALGGRTFATNAECFASVTACNDGADNDGDGNADLADGGCANAQDRNEADGATDIAVTLEAPAPQAARNGLYRVVLVARNLGPDTATSPVQFTANVPAAATYSQNDSADTCRMAGNEIVCTVDRMLLGAAYSYQLNLGFVMKPDASCAATVFHTANVRVTPQGDRVPANNMASVGVTVTGCPLLGDANGDGQITTGDPTRILQLSAPGATPTADELARSDANGNGRVTKADAYLVLGLISGQLDSLPAKFGDVTGDMNVTSLDASRVSQMITALARRDDGSFVASMLDLVAQLRVQDITARMRFLADVNRDGVIDQRDVDLIMQAATGIHFELPVEASNAAGLTQAAMSCRDGQNFVTVTYSKNFPECLHAKTSENQSIGTASNAYFCQPTGSTVLVPAGDLPGVAVGSQFKLCHGNDPNVCSPLVTVTGTACATQTQPTACAIPADMRKGVPHQNQANPYDANNDSGVTNADALAVTDRLNTAGAGPVPSTPATTSFFDVNGDNSITAMDSLLIINRINAGCGGYPVTPVACNPPQPKGVALQNQRNSLDVDDNSFISEQDAIAVIDYLRAVGAGAPPAGRTAPPFVDVNGDDVVSAQDALFVINRLRAGCAVPATTTVNGELFVTADATPVRQRQLLAGVLGDTAMRVELRAGDGEDVGVTMVRFVTVGGPANSVERLNVYKDDLNTPVGVATTTACTFGLSMYEGNESRTFCAALGNSVTVPKGQSVDLLVRPLLKSDVSGALSAEPIQLAIDTARGGGGGGGTTGGLQGQVTQTQNFGFVEARGIASNTVLAANKIHIGTATAGGAETPVVSPRHVSVLSKVAAIANANPDPDGTAVPTGIAPIGQFRFTAATNANTLNGLNSVTFTRMNFTVTYQNAQLDQNSFKVYNKADSSAKSPCRVAGGGGSANGPQALYVECDNLYAQTAAGDFSLPSGETRTFVLEANVQNAQVSATASSLVRVALENFSDPASSRGNLQWQDRDAGSNARTYQWIDYADTVVHSTNYGTAAGHAAATLTDNAYCSPIPGHAISGVGDVKAGQQFQIGIGMQNAGTSTWVTGAASPYTLVVADEASRSTWGVQRAAYAANANPISVQPNQYMSFALWPATAPATPGTYQLKVQMAKNGVPFGSVCTHNVVVKAATTTTTTPLVGENCPAVQTARQQMPLFGSAAKFRQTSDGKFLVWAEVVQGGSRNVKGVNYDTCETRTYGTAESASTGIDEISVSDNGKILYKDRTVIGDPTVGKLWLVDRATNAKTLVTDKAFSNGTGDRGLISRDGNVVVLTATANADNDPATTVSNADLSRELFLIRNGVITQVTNFNGGQSTYRDSLNRPIPNQYTGMNDALCEDAACRFVTVNLDYDPVTNKRHERDVLTTAAQPSDVTVWQSRLYLYDAQTKAFHKISNSSNVANRASFQSLINAKIAAITGSQGFLESAWSRVTGSIFGR